MADALDGIRVLDLSNRASGAWCTRLLADFGADVVLVEPPEGHALRRIGPFADDHSSIPAAYLLANKRSLVLEEAASDALARLVRWAQVIVDNARPGETADYASLCRINPGLVVCSLTPFGQDGEQAGCLGNDLTAYALSGWASLNGLLHRAPLKGSGLQASYQAGTMAYGAIVCALLYQQASDGEGQHIDIAELEVLCSTFAPGLLRTLLQGQTLQSRDQVDLTSGPIPIKDGYFSLPITRPHFWVKAMQLLGLPELAADENLQKTWYRLQHKELFQMQSIQNYLHCMKVDLL